MRTQRFLTKESLASERGEAPYRRDKLAQKRSSLRVCTYNCVSPNLRRSCNCSGRPTKNRCHLRQIRLLSEPSEPLHVQAISLPSRADRSHHSASRHVVDRSTGDTRSRTVVW